MMLTIETLETSSLGDRSYVVHDGRVAAVIDPQRDVDRILALVGAHGVRITHVLETHVHNDYVSGGLDLSRITGAAYLLPAGSDVEFRHDEVADGDTIAVGSCRLTALHTPGHTHHHMSYAVADADGAVRAVFSGGSLLLGATGRTDLVSRDDTVKLTHAQYHSVRRLAAELPGETEVLPTHGFGSFCSATEASADASTIAHERSVNPALTQGEEQYVRTLLAGLDAYPAYYAHIAPINRAGPAPIDLTPPRQVYPAELRQRIEAGEWVIDLRDRTAFAAGHLAGTLSFELADTFATYVGWLYTYGAPLTLIGESPDQIAEARRELVRIGIDELAGAASGDLQAVAENHPVGSYRVARFADLADARRSDDVVVVDARRADERAAGCVAGSLHVPISEFQQRLDEIPDGEVWVYCASGYRSAIATSMLDRHRRQVVLINDSYSAARKAGLEVVPPVTGNDGGTPDAQAD